jgi:hypothetical protein
VQTSSKLSKMAALLQEEARRQLRSECFNCGSRDHFAKSCKAPLNGCVYSCAAGGCGQSILVTSKGQTPVALPTPTAHRRNAASSSRPSSPAAAAPQPTRGRVASAAALVDDARPAKKLKSASTARGGKEVMVMNERYASLSWYLCSPTSNPTPKQVAIAKLQCSERALELEGCHTRALDKLGFAALPPATPKSLTGDRDRLGSNFVGTELLGVKIRRTIDGKLGCRLSQVIFHTVDLQQAFGS